MSSTQEDRLHAYMMATIGDELPAWPGGWPDEIEAALIDAVFSVRARYGRRGRGRETGVYGAVQRWRSHRRAQGSDAANDLRVLAGTSVDDLRAVTNSGKIRGRYKAEVVTDAANALVNAHVVTAGDLQAHEPAAKAAYLAVPGCGPVTWRYLRMLIGANDVKPDTWVMRFVRDELPEATNPSDAAALITAVAARMGVDAPILDHAIWAHSRAKSSGTQPSAARRGEEEMRR